MISFESDYNNGMLPEILEALGKTNSDKTSGYGFDPYSESAKEKIRKAVDNENAEVFFLIGGTQTNTTVIDSVLMGCEGVICVETGHIEVHESGAVEAFGHKVITLPGKKQQADNRHPVSLYGYLPSRRIASSHGAARHGLYLDAD